jgi:hypothetical protein
LPFAALQVNMLQRLRKMNDRIEKRIELAALVSRV